jgi:hypothetical protein
MLRLAAALLVRLGLVMLVLAVLVRLVPTPNQADVVVDDFAIAASLALVLVPVIYLRLTKDTMTRDKAQDGDRPTTTGSLTEQHGIRR